MKEAVFARTSTTKDMIGREECKERFAVGHLLFISYAESPSVTFAWQAEAGLAELNLNSGYIVSTLCQTVKRAFRPRRESQTMMREQRGPMAKPDGVCTQCYVEALAATWELGRMSSPKVRSRRKRSPGWSLVCSGGKA